MGLRPEVLRGIQTKGFERPSDVQTEAIPALLAGWDCVAQAPSGSGKTLGFAVPALQLLLAQTPPTGSGVARLPSPRVLIVTPTGVLAEQIVDVLRDLSRFMSPPPAVDLLTAGIKLTARSLDVVVATPHKLLDLLGLCGDGRPTRMGLGRVQLCVLDEADELLDKEEFRVQLAGVVRQLPPTSTMGYFSATLSRGTYELIRQENLVRSDKMVKVSAGDGVRPAISHFHVNVGDCPEDQIWEVKADVLRDLCDEFQGGGVIVFARSKGKRDFLARALGADRPNSRFTTNGERFLGMKTGVFLATDAFSRGFDVQHVAAVFNFEPAQSSALYTQRVGRAGRFGRAGTAVTLVDDLEKRDLSWLERDLHLEIPHLPNDLSTLPGVGTGELLPLGGAPSATPSTMGSNPPRESLAPATQPPRPSTASAASAVPPPSGLQFDMDQLVDALTARLLPLVTTLVDERACRIEASLGDRLDHLTQEVRRVAASRQEQQEEERRAALQTSADLTRIHGDLAALRQDVASLKHQDDLAESLRETTTALADLVAGRERIPTRDALAVTVPRSATAPVVAPSGGTGYQQPGCAPQHAPRPHPPPASLVSSASSASLSSLGSSSGLTTQSSASVSTCRTTAETPAATARGDGESWAAKVANGASPPADPAPAKLAPKKHRPLGNGVLHPSQLKPGSIFRGVVVKVLPSKRGGCFVRFGDDKVHCNRDGFARFPQATVDKTSGGGDSHDPQPLEVGQWVSVVVRKVTPPTVQEGSTAKSPRWLVDLGLVD